MAQETLGMLLTAIEAYLRDVVGLVERLAAQDAGRDVLGAVPGRAMDEDVEIALDRACDQLLQRHLRASGARVETHSEHGTFRTHDNGAPPDYLVAVDPFDGSGLFRRGLRAEWWSVLSVFHPGTLEPLAGGAVDVLRRELYLVSPGTATVAALDTGRQGGLAPSPKTALDAATTVAAYLMDPRYLADWTSRGARLVQRLREVGARVWPNGGSCIYPWLARGLLHAYVMFDEVHSEIDPGLAFAAAAGYPVYSLAPGGHLRPYRFTPGGQAQREPCLIAACTPELAEAIAALVTP